MIKKHFYMSEGAIDFLEGLDGLSTSEHVRRAVDDYIILKKIASAKATTSPSRTRVKKGVKNYVG